MEATIDKSKEVRGSIKLINNKLQFNGNVEGNTPVQIDYIPPLGDNLGYTSLELFLLSLSSCVGTAMLVVLRKMQKTIQSFEISSVGFRKQEHPTGFKSINMEVKIKSDNLTTDELNKILPMIDGICPVLSMIKENVEVVYSFVII